MEYDGISVRTWTAVGLLLGWRRMAGKQGGRLLDPGCGVVLYCIIMNDAKCDKQSLKSPPTYTRPTINCMFYNGSIYDKRV